MLLAWVLTMAAVAISSLLERHDNLVLLNREAKVTKAESHRRLSQDVDAVADDLDQRQTFIEKMVEDLCRRASRRRQGRRNRVRQQQGGDQDRRQGERARSPRRRRWLGSRPRQLAFAERLTRFADRKSAAAEAAMRKLGLDPRPMLASLDDRSAMGGPLIRVCPAPTVRSTRASGASA